MYKNDDTSNFNFREAEKFLENILEIRKIVSNLIRIHEEMNATVVELDGVLRSIYEEIHKSDNK